MSLVRFNLVGQAQLTYRELGDAAPPLEVELDGWPREGETVDLPGLQQHETVVRTVVHYPWGDGEDATPFVWVILGNARPS